MSTASAEVATAETGATEAGAVIMPSPSHDSDEETKSTIPGATITSPVEDTATSVTSESVSSLDYREKLEDAMIDLASIERNIGKLTGSISEFVRLQKALSPNTIIPPEIKPFYGPDHINDGKVTGEFGTAPTKVIPEVYICNWEQFKNPLSSEEAVHAIEALVAGDSFKRDIEDEEERREMEDPIRTLGDIAKTKTRRTVDPGTRFDDDNLESYSRDDKDTWIKRVRINSSAVIKILDRHRLRHDIGGDELHGHSLTFLRPFRFLIHFYDDMKRDLEKMKDVVAERQLRAGAAMQGADDGSCIGGTTKAAPSDQQVAGIFPDDSGASRTIDGAGNRALDELYSSSEALGEVQCYVNFVEEHLLPAYCQFDHDAPHPADTVRYDDLSYLFKHGELIYYPNPRFSLLFRRPDEHSRGPPSAQQTFFRITGVFESTSDSRVSRIGCVCERCRGERDFKIRAYYIENDGQLYHLVEDLFAIGPYQGRKPISELPFYPIRFMKEAKILSDARLCGTAFADHIYKSYGFYSGWTMISGPTGARLEDTKGDPIKHPEHIESDVLVDFTEAFNSCPGWKTPKQPSPPPPPGLMQIKVDKVQVKHWADSIRGQLISSHCERVVYNDGVGAGFSKLCREVDPFSVLGGRRLFAFSQDDLILLPRRMFAYAVWERKFVHIDSRCLKRETRKGEADEAFQMLQIDDNNKRLIKSLVHAHFDKKNAETLGINIGTQDLIRGKGKGVVFLLHGAPGVGKTATAEAVAQKWKRPLFPVTCGDLGFTPEAVERSLTEIFRLAHLWDCVLLLDEADVFITQRDRNDLRRNALVSVFLRMLEYYNGIMFLTTNRVGVVDEAVKSRVHLHLHYPALNKAQTVQIFKFNIERLRETETNRSQVPGHQRLEILDTELLQFAEDHFERHAKSGGVGRWNGRQIRNAFLIASSLAHYEAHDSPNPDSSRKELRRFHFETVEKSTTLFDKYRSGVLGGSDGYVAQDRMERIHKFDIRDNEAADQRPTSSVRLPHFSSYPPPQQPWSPSAGYQNAPAQPPGGYQNASVLPPAGYQNSSLASSWTSHSGISPAGAISQSIGQSVLLNVAPSQQQQRPFASPEQMAARVGPVGHGALGIDPNVIDNSNLYGGAGVNMTR